ncbi:MAG: hypothetical protein DRI32_08305 [Chloroflexi bacterium]|nr:MAG: hypothetical protein DRI32_08305 [Chloroflexota bacterium]
MKKTLHLAFLLIIAFSVLVSVAPSNHPVPGRDQGVYLYVGEQILDGSVPYRDIWDHKGPVIYYINALGLASGMSTYWGVWLLEVISLFIALLFSYINMEKCFSAEAAFFGTAMWVLGFAFVINGGNTVEEFTLPLQFLSLFFFLRASEEKKHYWNEFLIGVFAGIAFFIRPNNIGEPVVIGIIIGMQLLFLEDGRKRAFFRLISIGVGFLVFSLVIVGYFFSQDALNEFWRSAFIYNFQYLAIAPDRWKAIIKGISYLSPLVPLGFSAWIMGLGYFFLSKKKDLRERNILAFALLILPIDFALSLTSGRRYLHYFTAWLLPFGFFVGFFAYKFQCALQNTDDRNFPKWLKPSKIWLYLIFLSFGFLQFQNLLPATKNFASEAIRAKGVPDGGNNITGSPCEYIKNHTEPDDYVLIWGNEVQCNFLTKRESPSRFVYLYPLMLGGYLSTEEIEQFRKDIENKKPLIIDATSDDDTVFSPSSNRWEEVPRVASIVEFVLENYVSVDQIPNSNWEIWVQK